MPHRCDPDVTPPPQEAIRAAAAAQASLHQRSAQVSDPTRHQPPAADLGAAAHALGAPATRPADGDPRRLRRPRPIRSATRSLLHSAHGPTTPYPGRPALSRALDRHRRLRWREPASAGRRRPARELQAAPFDVQRSPYSRCHLRRGAAALTTGLPDPRRPKLHELSGSELLFPFGFGPLDDFADRFALGEFRGCAWSAVRWGRVRGSGIRGHRRQLCATPLVTPAAPQRLWSIQ